MLVRVSGKASHAPICCMAADLGLVCTIDRESVLYRCVSQLGLGTGGCRGEGHSK